MVRVAAATAVIALMLGACAAGTGSGHDIIVATHGLAYERDLNICATSGAVLAPVPGQSTQTGHPITDAEYATLLRERVRECMIAKGHRISADDDLVDVVRWPVAPAQGLTRPRIIIMK